MKPLHLLLFLLVLAVPVIAQKPATFPSGRVVDLTYAFDAEPRMERIENTDL